MIDPEEFEQAMATQLTAQFPGWDVAPTNYAQAGPQSVLVRYTGTEVDQRQHGELPGNSQASAAIVELRLMVRFISARQAARGAFLGVLEGLMAACRTLTQERRHQREQWLVDSLTPLEVKGQAEQPTRALDGSVSVRMVVAA